MTTHNRHGHDACIVNLSPKHIAIALLLLVIGYLGVLPLFWPDPSVRADYPAHVTLGQDIDITVRVSAWHPLFEISRIRLVPDPERSTAFDPSAPLAPLQPFGVPPRRFGHGDMFKRFTWPIRRARTVRAGLSQEYVADKLQPGQLEGVFQVTCTFARSKHRYLATEKCVQEVPFSIRVHPAN